MRKGSAVCTCSQTAKHAGACRGRSRIYSHTSATDAVIRETYGKLRKFGNRRALKALREKLGRPKHAINRRGRELGLARAKEKPWTPEEKALLEKWGHLTLQGICRKLQRAGFQRSEAGVKLKMRRMLITKDTLDYYSASKIASAMGIDGHKVAGWVRRGWLRAEKKGTLRTAQTGRRQLPRACERLAPVFAASSR